MGTRLLLGSVWCGRERAMGGNNSSERKPKGVVMGLLTYDQLRELADQYQGTFHLSSCASSKPLPI